MTAPLLLTEPEAATALSLCPRTLRKARQQGRLPYVLIGKAIRYTLADLEQFIAAAHQLDQPCPEPKPRLKASAARSGDRVVVPFTQRR